MFCPRLTLLGMLREVRGKHKNVQFGPLAVFGGIIRDGKALMSYGDFQIESGDKAIVFCLPEAIHIVEDLFR